jgi:hypothetical protein
MSVYVLCGELHCLCTVWGAPLFVYCVGSSTVCVLRGELHRLCTVWEAPLFVYCVGSSTVCVLRGELHCLCTVWGAPLFVYCKGSSTVCVLVGSSTVWRDFECIFAVNHEVACRGVKSCSCHTKCRVFLSYEHDGVCLL